MQACHVLKERKAGAPPHGTTSFAPSGRRFFIPATKGKKHMANGFYVATFSFPEVPGGEARMVVELRDGLVHTTHDVNGPTPIEMTDFFAFKRIDLALAA
jgi:hypothetical protein